jgi:hypothetical protein
MGSYLACDQDQYSQDSTRIQDIQEAACYSNKDTVMSYNSCLVHYKLVEALPLCQVQLYQGCLTFKPLQQVGELGCLLGY